MKTILFGKIIIFWSHGAAWTNSGPLCPAIFNNAKLFFSFGVKFLQFTADAVKSRP